MKRLAFIVCCLLAMLSPSAPSYADAIEIERIAITVSNLDQTEAFYRDGLGFQTVERRSIDDPALMRLLGVSQPIDTLTMQLGQERIEFDCYRRLGRGYPANSRSQDFWFQHFAIVVADMDTAYQRLQRVRFEPVSIGGPQTLPKEDGHVRAFKFRDPDGHPLELLYFPPGQGRKRWSKHTGPVDLGVDHTAICVSKTAAGIAFYHGLLGMKIAYEVVNRGRDQQRLDAVVHARVRITGLRPESQTGPGIELLDYRPPTSRRPAPERPQAEDLWHVHVVLRFKDLDRLLTKLSAAHSSVVSQGVVDLGNGVRAIEILDPDGHAIVLEE